MDALSLVTVGILLFSAAVVFQLLTLPVEFNASRRAVNIIQNQKLLSHEELPGVRKVLTAAAMTYVASLLTSVLQLLYYISRANRRRR